MKRGIKSRHEASGPIHLGPCAFIWSALLILRDPFHGGSLTEWHGIP